MKMYLKSLIGVIVLLFFTAAVNAQTTTFILLRHAEKDTSSYGSMMMNADPPLSKAGELRAERLINVLAAFKPDIIYSTNYKRTKATAAPLAAQSGKEIQLYDPKKLPLFADSLLLVKGKTIVVVGHSNTTPALVDLLIKENKYAALDDAEYGTYWIVTLQNGKAIEEVRKY